MTQRAHNPETFDEKLAQLNELREAAVHSSPEAEAKQHERGKYTARERIDKRLDVVSDTHVANLILLQLPADGVARAVYRLPTERRVILTVGPLEVMLSDPFC